MLTLASRTPGTPATAFSTWCGISSAEGQFGVVKVISNKHQGLRIEGAVVEAALPHPPTFCLRHSQRFGANLAKFVTLLDNRATGRFGINCI